MSERPWYKRFPSDFIAGTVGMTLEERGMYNILVDLMYDRNEMLPNDISWLARVADCSRQAAARLRDRLVAMKKIYITTDGRISHKRVEAQMVLNQEDHKKFQENGRKGQEIWQKNRQVLEMKPSEVNDLAEKEPPAVHIPDTRKSTRSLSESEGAPAKSPQGKRLPDDWRPSEAGVQLACELGIDLDRTLATFRDYWLAQPGQKGRKADWEATWRNWCRRQQEMSSQPKLPMLRSIDGGKSPPNEPADPSDDWGIDGWCRSLPGVEAIVDPELQKRGKWSYGGLIIDSVARKVADAAGFKRSWRGDLSPLAQWIDAGLRPGEHITPVVKKLADYFSTKGEPATNLRVFDKAVRERQAA